MSDAWLHALPWLLAALGIALAALAAWLRIMWRRLHRLTRDLARLEPQDALLWPRQAEPALRLAGVVALRWQGEWLGCALDDGWGERRADAAHWSARLLIGEDIAVEVRGWWRRARGEAAALAELACQVFWLHWQAAGRQQSAAIDAALQARARHALGLLHDVRNFAQWAIWTVDALAQARDDDARLDAAKALAQRAPEVRARAQSLLARTRGGEAADGRPPDDLAALVRNTAAMHGLPLDVAGEAQTRTATSVWLVVLDNLFINAMQHREPQQPTPCAHLRPGPAGCELTLRLPGQRLDIPAGQLFAPLARQRPDGLGLGLWHARRAARAAGGDLIAQAEPLAFTVRLP